MTESNWTYIYIYIYIKESIISSEMTESDGITEPVTESHRLYNVINAQCRSGINLSEDYLKKALESIPWKSRACNPNFLSTIYGVENSHIACIPGIFFQRYTFDNPSFCQTQTRADILKICLNLEPD